MSSKPKTLRANEPSSSTIAWWLRDAAEQLARAGITSALLDAEIILAHTLRRSRTFLHAHADDEVSPRLLDIANARLDLRLDRTPVAYIIGHKEFYGRLFRVTPSVLIPRPESETIIELIAKYYDGSQKRLVDIGTGSGCLGITAKLEHPLMTVILSDIDTKALVVASENAASLAADVHILQSDLFSVLPGVFDYIIANLPYVDASWERSPETAAEPKRALFAAAGGLSIINDFVADLPSKLAPGGTAFIEADPVQHATIVTNATKLGLVHLESTDYTVVVGRR